MTALGESGHTGERLQAYSAHMKRSSKAALLSGLIFPGIGHMVLKQYLRGSVLIILGACWLIGIIDSYRLGIAKD